MIAKSMIDNAVVAIENLHIIPSFDDEYHPKKDGPWYVIDERTADRDCNYHGELISEHSSQASAERGRARAILHAAFYGIWSRNERAPYAKPLGEKSDEVEIDQETIPLPLFLSPPR
jgi:hypothetical protein